MSIWHFAFPHLMNPPEASGLQAPVVRLCLAIERMYTMDSGRAHNFTNRFQENVH